MATHEIEEASESQKHKTWSLRVPINCACEGCKKKVRRILYKVQGVSTVDVDTRQQKVTVTGDVQPDALIKKLARHGKEAKLCPENSDPPETKSGKSKNKEKQSNPETGKPATVQGGDKEVKPPVKSESVEQGKKPDTGSAGKGKGTAAAGELTGGGAAAKEAKSDGKKPDTGSAGNQSSPPAVDTGGADIESVENGGDVDKKKGEGQKGKIVEGETSRGVDVERKKNKGQKGKLTEGETLSGTAPARTDDGSGPPPANQSLPRHQGYQHHQPPHYNAPPPVVSYNMAQPSSSYTALYPQPPPYSYAHSHPDPMVQAPPSNYPMYPPQAIHAPPFDYHSYPPQPLESFEIISDENPNGCLIM